MQTNKRFRENLKKKAKLLLSVCIICTNNYNHRLCHHLYHFHYITLFLNNVSYKLLLIVRFMSTNK